MRLISPGTGPGTGPGQNGPDGPDAETAAAARRRHLGRLKTIVREHLHLSDEVPVVISELRCSEEDCAPVETVIAVLAAPTRTWKIPRSQDQVSPGDLIAVFRDHPDGGHA